LKINKHNPVHWCQLATFALQAVIGLFFRPFRKKSAIVLYGHKLNGNLLPIYQRCPSAIFLSMDRAYCRELQYAGIRSQWACSPRAAALLARTLAIISDHGLHSLEIMLPAYRKAGLRCIDVWHGIPFKGFDINDFRLQHEYDEIWVASTSQRSLWIEKFGFSPDKVHATGYMRTDRLILRTADESIAKLQLGLDPSTCGKTILFAPTWTQDDEGRSIYPFGCNEQQFLAALSALAVDHGATILLRSHLNTGAKPSPALPRIVSLPSTIYPDAESILLASDVLVCDWSSIAFDFLLLDRPTLFLDVPPPFRKGFSLGPEYRFGSIVKDLHGLLRMLEMCINQPRTYWQAHEIHHQDIKERVYGNMADGNATENCIARLRKISGKPETRALSSR